MTRRIIGDDNDDELTCEHGIGHGNNVHTCDPDRHGNKCPLPTLAHAYKMEHGIEWDAVG